MQARTNYLNDDEVRRRLKLNNAQIRMLHLSGLLQLVKTTTGYLVLTDSIDRFESKQPYKLAMMQLYARKVSTRGRLKRSQRTHEL